MIWMYIRGVLDGGLRHAAPSQETAIVWNQPEKSIKHRSDDRLCTFVDAALLRAKTYQSDAMVLDKVQRMWSGLAPRFQRKKRKSCFAVYRLSPNWRSSSDFNSSFIFAAKYVGFGTKFSGARNHLRSWASQDKISSNFGSSPSLPSSWSTNKTPFPNFRSWLQNLRGLPSYSVNKLSLFFLYEKWTLIFRKFWKIFK